MPMSELKQRLLKIEFAKIGFPDAVFSVEHSAVLINPTDERMPKIKDNGDIHYGSEYDSLVSSQIRPIVSRVNEITAAWEKAPAVPFEDISRFRILSEYNGAALAARDDSEYGLDYCLKFVTWRYNYERTGFEHGNYTTDYDTAKEDFAVRSGLVDRRKLFNETELTLIRQGLVYLGADYPDLTSDQMTILGKVVEKIEELVPAIRQREELEAHNLVPDDGLEV